VFLVVLLAVVRLSANTFCAAISRYLVSAFLRNLLQISIMRVSRIILESDVGGKHHDHTKYGQKFVWGPFFTTEH